MNMKVGKIFVMLQFVASTMLLGVVALGIYPHRMNPTTKISHGTERLQSTIERYDERIRDLAAARDRADQRWRESLAYLGAVEQERPLRQQLFAYKLAVARTGLDLTTGNKVAQPVTEIRYDPQGRLALAGAPPVQYRGVDVLCYNDIVEKLRELNRNEEVGGQLMLGKIPQQQGLIKRLVQEYDALSQEILGDGANVRGLRKERELQEEAKAKAIAQQEYLKPFLANRYAETVLVLKRQNGLLSRKRELEKVGLASAPGLEK